MNSLPLFILASASPRRKELLTGAGYTFEVHVPEVDESALGAGGISAEQYTRQLAQAKAHSIARRFPDRLVIGADTVADFEGRIIGKPVDAEDAERITRMLFSAPHRVVTGLALVWPERGIEIVRSDTTVVYPKKMTEPQIAEHLAGGSWQGKAGAYAIQETGDQFVERIDGSLTNVMGLPMELLDTLLRQLTQSL